MSTDEMLIDLRSRGFHPEIFASESHKHAWLAKVRGYQEVGGRTPQDAMTALFEFVERKRPMTTTQLRKQGAQ